jgi:hypothetical protein
MMKSFTAENVGIEIIRAAAEWLDMYEVAPNAAWSSDKNERFQALLRRAGHQPGWPYCMTAAKAWWMMGYTTVGADARVLQYIQKMFTPSVITTYINLKRFVVQTRPQPGALLLQRKGTTPHGHAGIVVLSGPARFVTIEANTSPGVASTTAEREGDGVYLKPPKPLEFKMTPGLHTLGFVNPLGSAQIEALLK